MSGGAANSERRVISARPQAISVTLSETAVVVVDMQNDFGSKGGMFDLAGIPLSEIRSIVPSIALVLRMTRALGIPTIYTKMAFRPDLSDLGSVGSPNRERHLMYGVGKPVAGPGGHESRILIRDTWSSDVIPDLKPLASDIVLYKHRYSAFFETELDAILKNRGIRNLIFTGCTTSVCIESTIRDAFFRDYCCILLADCTAEPIGPGAEGYKLMDHEGRDISAKGRNYETTLLLVQALFGWVSDADAITEAFKSPTLRQT
jgi:ureidoacrylate peracid hydrolase